MVRDLDRSSPSLPALRAGEKSRGRRVPGGGRATTDAVVDAFRTSARLWPGKSGRLAARRRCGTQARFILGPAAEFEGAAAGAANVHGDRSLEPRRVPERTGGQPLPSSRPAAQLAGISYRAVRADAQTGEARNRTN